MSVADFDGGKSAQYMRSEGCAALPGPYTPNDWVRAGPDKIILACTNQSLWSGVLRHLCVARPPQGLIVVIQEGLGRYIPTVQITTEIPTTALAIDIDAELVFAGQADGLVEVYSLRNDEFNREWGLSAHTMEVSCMALTDDNKVLITCGLDRELKLWDRSMRSQLASLQVGSAGLSCLLLRPCPGVLPGADLLVGSLDSNIYGIQLKDATGRNYSPQVLYQFPTAHSGSIQSICTTEDLYADVPAGRRPAEPWECSNETRARLFTASFDRSVGVWEGVPRLAEDGSYVTEPRLIGRLNEHNGTVRCLLWLPGRGELLSGGADGRITFWRLETVGFRPLAAVQAHEYAVVRMALAASGRLVSVGDDSYIKTWVLDGAP